MRRIEITAERLAVVAAYERACALHVDAELAWLAGEAVNVGAARRLVDALHPAWVAAGGHFYEMQDAFRSARRRYAKALPELVADVMRAATLDDAEAVAAGAY
jgi:hypothetical protein